MAEDSVTLTLAEWGEMQTENLKLRSDNEKLKAKADKHDSLLKLTQDQVDQINSLKLEIESAKSNTPNEPIKFSRSDAFACLKAIRKQDYYTEEEEKLVEELLTIAEYMWPKNVSQTSNQLTEEAKNYLADKMELDKLRSEKMKLKLAVESWEGKCKAIQTALDSTATHASNLEEQLKKLESQKDNLIHDLAFREDEVNEAREKLKDKYQLECDIHDLQIEKEKLMKEIEAKDAEILSLRGTGSQTLMEKVEKLTKENEDLTSKLEDIQATERCLALEYENLKTSTKKSLSDLKNSQNRVKELEAEVTKLAELNRSLNQELEDTRTEKQIVQKRSMHDLKDLKSELAKEKTAHEQVKMEREKMYQEVRRLQDLQRNLGRGRGGAVTAEERAIVEDLALRVQELDIENKKLKERVSSILYLETENQHILEENEELKDEIGKLQMDMASLGAQFNSLIRSGSIQPC